MASCMTYLGLVFGILALGCAACGIGLEYWVESEDGRSYSGLWRRCRPVGMDDTLCENELDDDYMPEYNAVRSMVIIGAAVLLISVIAGCIAIVSRKLATMVHLGLVSTIGHVIAGVFMMIGFVVFLEEIYWARDMHVTNNLSAGFILCVLGWLTCWTAGALILAGTYATKRKHSMLVGK